MKCNEVQNLLHPYSDGELDLVRQVEIEEHLSDCSECGEQEKNLRSLRTAISTSTLYQRAPSALRERVQNANPPEIREVRRHSSMPWPAIAAGVLLVFGAGVAIGVVFGRRGSSADELLADRIVASHVRSLQAEHLTDVVSSDRHTVKPWFRGKLDFSPAVPDLSAEGFKLSGGRLDYLEDRPVAALVYFNRQHAINLFIWPAGTDENKDVRRLAHHGFNIRSWQHAGMNCWTISDLNGEELDEFVRLYQENTPPR
jgi:anti-sigma factor RsiW